MATLFLVFSLLVVLNEGLNERLVNPVVDWLGKTITSSFEPSKIVTYTTLLTGVVLAYVFTSPLIDFVVTQLGLPSVEINAPITIMFGLVIGLGAQFYHDFWGSIVAIRIVTGKPQNQ